MGSNQQLSSNSGGGFWCMENSSTYPPRQNYADLMQLEIDAPDE
jgi:hypothetical protein